MASAAATPKSEAEPLPEKTASTAIAARRMANQIAETDTPIGLRMVIDSRGRQRILSSPARPTTAAHALSGKGRVR